MHNNSGLPVHILEMIGLACHMLTTMIALDPVIAVKVEHDYVQCPRYSALLLSYALVLSDPAAGSRISCL